MSTPISSQSSSEMQQRLASAFRAEAAMCGRDGSPLYGLLLERAAEDIATGGPCWDVLGEEAAARLRANPALQLMGALHRLVLTGMAPELARFYPSANPSAGGAPPVDAADQERVWAIFRQTIADLREEVRMLARQPVQTNEVGRSAALVGGFLTVARETGLPLRLLELGASAGLNLRWDAYRYEADGLAWGDPSSPVRFSGVYTAGRPPLATPARVADRAGCDRSPLDASRAEDRLTLLSYMWADQIARIQRLRAALALAATLPVRIETASAPDWIEKQLAEPALGLATVVFHSIVIGYLSKEDRARLFEVIVGAGQRATQAAPLAWLRMEGDARDATDASIRLTLWPDGAERLIGRAGFHGQDVRWLG